MANTEVHTTVQGIVFHNPGAAPLAAGAGQPVVAAAKNPGQPNGTVHGQVTMAGAQVSIIIHNPG